MIKNSENGYKGYKFNIEQVDSPSEDPAEAAAQTEAENTNKAVNDESKSVYLKVSVHHLDWKSIQTDESEETFTDYQKSLGLFILLTNQQSGLS